MEAGLREECLRLISDYPEPAGALLPILHRVQQVDGHLSTSAITEVAALLALPPARVLGVASFYPAFRTQPRGRHLIQVCSTLSCCLMGSGEVLSSLGAKLGIGVGETTADGRFTLERVGCLASCGTAPVMTVDGELHQSLTGERIGQIVESLD
jgi:NADH-quinone oxidoreductase subunit E